MTDTRICFVLLCLLAVAGCSGHHDAAVDHAHSDDHPVEESTGLNIALNDGKPWEMDDYTREMFHAMTARLDSEDSAKALGEGLKADLGELIQGCTMTGEAHDRLHDYLMVYMPAVNQLAESGADEDRETVDALLRQHGNYFE